MWLCLTLLASAQSEVLVDARAGQFTLVTNDTYAEGAEVRRVNPLLSLGLLSPWHADHAQFRCQAQLRAAASAWIHAHQQCAEPRVPALGLGAHRAAPRPQTGNTKHTWYQQVCVHAAGTCVRSVLTPHSNPYPYGTFYITSVGATNEVVAFARLRHWVRACVLDVSSADAQPADTHRV